MQPRLVPRSARPRIRRSVIWTNVALVVVVGGLCWLIGWRAYLLVQVPTALLAGVAGVWLFYVQHQFEDAYWQDAEEWSYADAALRGSSYLKLPQVLQFFTGNIGLHHVHHLSARIPNYNLQRAHDENPIFQDVPTLSLWDGLRAVRLKLWDERSGRLSRGRRRGVASAHGRNRTRRTRHQRRADPLGVRRPQHTRRHSAEGPGLDRRDLRALPDPRGRAGPTTSPGSSTRRSRRCPTSTSRSSRLPSRASTSSSAGT